MTPADWDREPTCSEDTYRWRTTRRKGGRMLYAQVGPDPSDADVPVGFMRSPELAEAVVWAHNVMHAAREQRALGVGLHDGCVAREALVPLGCVVDHQLLPGKACEYAYRIRTDEDGQATQ